VSDATPVVAEGAPIGLLIGRKWVQRGMVEAR
jgi:hypothetical protein